MGIVSRENNKKVCQGVEVGVALLTAEFLQNEDEVDHGQRRGGKMVIAEEVDQGHQSDEGIDLFQGHHLHEGTEDHHPQGEEDQGHHHLDALEDHAQSLLQTRGNPIRTL